MKRVLSLTLCLVLLLGSVLPALAATGVPEEVMEATKSVVRIRSEYKRSVTTGSGFVIKNDGSEILVATNNHVVENDPQKVQIWVSQDRLVDAQIVFAVPAKDLCVLRITERLSMAPLTLATEEAKHGEAIFAVGYPGAGDVLSDVEAHTSESVTITDGIISAIRTFTAEEGAAPVKLLQINAAINPGNSGGPLFNMQGQVIGVNTYKVNLESQGVFGSVDISELWNLLEQYDISLVEETVPTETATAPTEPVEEKITVSAGVLIGGGCAAAAVVLIIVLFIIKKGRKKKAPAETARTLSLQEYMAAYPQGLGPQGAVSLLMGVALQLRNYHNDGRLHLQVCPENVRVGVNGAVLAEPGPQETGRFRSGFAAPEIYRGAGFGIASDVYSFAALLLYAATGSIPGNSLQLDAVEQSIGLLSDAAFADLIRRAMAPEIQNRLQSMQEMIYGMAPYNVPGQVQLPQAAARKVEKAPAPEAPKAAPEVPKAAPEVPKAVPKKGRAKPILIAVAAVAVIAVAAGLLLWQGLPGGAEEAQLETAPTATTEGDTAESMAYADAEQLLASGDKARAAMAFGKLGDYKDARVRSFALWDEIAHRDTVSGGDWGDMVMIKNSGTAVSVQNADVFTVFHDVIAVSAGRRYTLGLKADGTVVSTDIPNWAKDEDYGQTEVSGWTDIVAIAAGRGGRGHSVGLRSDGTVVAVGNNEDGQCDVAGWTDIIAVSAGECHTVGLKADGTVVAAGKNDAGQCNVSGWTGIIAVQAVGWKTVGLRSDGTVATTGTNYWHELDVHDWQDVTAISLTNSHTVALTSDGALLATGNNDQGQLKFPEYYWHDIEAVYAVGLGTVGLRSDGTLAVSGSIDGRALTNETLRKITDIALPGTLKMKAPEKAPETVPGEEATGSQEEQYAAAEAMLAAGEKAKAAMAFGKLGDYKDARTRSFALWDEIAQRETLVGYGSSLLAITTDGRVLRTGGNQTRWDTDAWTDIVALGNGWHMVGLKADGTVVASGVPNPDEDHGQCDLSDWKDIVNIAAGEVHTVGLKSDGTVVARGSNEYGQCDVSSWTDIVDIRAGYGHTVGLKRDGTVVAVGLNDSQQCNVGTWSDIVSIAVHSWRTLGLRSDGTVVCQTGDIWGASQVGSWENVTAIACGNRHSVGLKADGTLITAGSDQWGQCKFQEYYWQDIVAITAGTMFTAGLRSDGTVAVAGAITGSPVTLDEVKAWEGVAMPGTLKMRAP